MGLKTRGVWDDSELDEELESLARPSSSRSPSRAATRGPRPARPGEDDAAPGPAAIPAEEAATPAAVAPIAGLHVPEQVPVPAPAQTEPLAPSYGSRAAVTAEPIPPVRRGQPKRHLMVQLDSDLVEQIRLRFSVGPGQRTQAELLAEVLDGHFAEVVTVIRQDRGPRRGAAVQQWGARVPLELFNKLTQSRVVAGTGASQRAAVEAALRVALLRLGDAEFTVR